MIIAATGHRPDKLGGYSAFVSGKLYKLAREYLALSDADEVISGMALGWDTAIAQAALDLGLTLTAAIPFEGQERLWPNEAQKHYRFLVARATYVRTISPGGYAPEKMQKRNVWMVRSADRMLALWNGSPGGTANCLRYAQERGVPFDNLWAEFTR